MNKHQKNFKNLIQPYIFVLKEGAGINDNYLDYSLLLLQVGRINTIRSPDNCDKIGNPTTHLLKS
jgi:hypothetical protein